MRRSGTWRGGPLQHRLRSVDEFPDALVRSRTQLRRTVEIVGSAAVHRLPGRPPRTPMASTGRPRRRPTRSLRAGSTSGPGPARSHPATKPVGWPVPAPPGAPTATPTCRRSTPRPSRSAARTGGHACGSRAQGHARHGGVRPAGDPRRRRAGGRRPRPGPALPLAWARSRRRGAASRSSGAPHQSADLGGLQGRSPRSRVPGAPRRGGFLDRGAGCATPTSSARGARACVQYTIRRRLGPAPSALGGPEAEPGATPTVGAGAAVPPIADGTGRIAGVALNTARSPRLPSTNGVRLLVQIDPR
jgi:hypothetical protein